MINIIVETRLSRSGKQDSSNVYMDGKKKKNSC